MNDHDQEAERLLKGALEEERRVVEDQRNVLQSIRQHVWNEFNGWPLASAVKEMARVAGLRLAEITDLRAQLASANERIRALETPPAAEPIPEAHELGLCGPGSYYAERDCWPHGRYVGAVREPLDPATGYPPGHVPHLWRCTECGLEWADSEQRGMDVAWECDAECGACDRAMVRVRPLANKEEQ